MEVRRATIEDIEELARLEALAFPKEEAASKERIAERMMRFPDYCWILCEIGPNVPGTNGPKVETILAYINGIATDEKDLQDIMYEDPAMHHADGKNLMIFSVVTNPLYLHRGYASYLMDFVIKDCRKSKQALVLTCKEHLVGFYQKFGYKEEGISVSSHGGAIWHQMRYTY